MMCSRCHKRVAVIFLTKMENGESKQEGLCIKCAKELGIKPIDDMLAQSGLDDETIERLNTDMESVMEDMGDPDDPDNPQTRTPFLNFAKLMNEGRASEDKNAKGADKGKKMKKGDKKDLAVIQVFFAPNQS